MASIPQVLFTPAWEDRGVTQPLAVSPGVTPEEAVTSLTFGSKPPPKLHKAKAELCSLLPPHKSQQPQLRASMENYFTPKCSNLHQLFPFPGAMRSTGSAFTLNKEFLS